VVLSAGHSPVVVQPTAADCALAARKTGLDVRVAGDGDIIGDHDGLASAVAKVIRELGHQDGRVGVVGLAHILSVGAHRTLVNALPDATIEDATFIVANIKAIKSATELVNIRATMAIADEGMRVLVGHLRPGITGWELNGDIERAIRRRGARYSLVFLSAAPYFIAAPSDRPFKSGDLVTAYVEVTGVDGYWVELARLFAIGELDDEAEQLAGACLAAAADAEGLMVVEGPVTDVAAAIERRAETVAATSGIWHGHGVGIDHDLPVVSHTATERFHDGCVISVHPNFRSASGRYGASVADTYAIVSTGTSRLSSIPRELQRVPA
jgi:Xaa-Pro aminopeptidase